MLAVARSLPRYPGQLNNVKLDNCILKIYGPFEQDTHVPTGRIEESPDFYSLQQCSVLDVLFRGLETSLTP